MTYEITYMLADESKDKSVVELITAQGGSFKQTKAWGKRDLAYPINKHTTAYYFTGDLEITEDKVDGLKKKLNFGSDVMRYLILKKD